MQPKTDFQPAIPGSFHAARVASLVALSLAVCVFSAACSGAAKTAGNEGSDNAKASPTATPKPTKTLTVHKRYISTDKDTGDVLFDPESDRRKATYEHYRFAAADWAKHVNNGAAGDTWTTLTIAVEVVEQKSSRHKPAADMPSPEGGFTHVRHQVRIVKVTPSK